jgi:hypothetical protein
VIETSYMKAINRQAVRIGAKALTWRSIKTKYGEPLDALLLKNHRAVSRHIALRLGVAPLRVIAPRKTAINEIAAKDSLLKDGNAQTASRASYALTAHNQLGGQVAADCCS